MRLSIWNQFSSNHSGSFMVVGTFATVESAAEAEKTLQRIISDLYQWFDRPDNKESRWGGLGNPPAPVEAELIRKYNLPTRQTLDLGSGDVRGSLSISTAGNLVKLFIKETWAVDQHDPLKDLMLRLGAEQAAIDHQIDDARINEVQYHLICTVPGEGDCFEETKVYLDKLFLNEYGMDEDEDEELSFPREVTADGRQMSISLRLPGVWDGIQPLYDFLQACGCTDIRWQVEDFKKDEPFTPKPPKKRAKEILLPPDNPPEEVLVQSDGIPNFTWCEVPAGKFIMGGDPEAWNHASNGIPEIQAELDYSFWIAKYPVTNSQYKPFDKIEGRTPDHPVVGVSWYEAYAYTQWLDDLRQRGKLVLPSQLPLPSQEYVIRLPRECEWEKAARYPDGRLFPWGNEWDPARLNWGKSGIGGTSTVGRFRDGANPSHGACDMLGNVCEWCLTLWQPTPSLEDENNNPQSKGFRCIRSGSWEDGRRDILRSVARFTHDPGTTYNDLGFRVVLSIRL